MSDEYTPHPLIGVILMVAVTVILAAVISAFVFGLSDIAMSNQNISNATSNITQVVNTTVTIAKMCCECVPC